MTNISVADQAVDGYMGNLESVLAELRRQQATKVDVVVDSRKVELRGRAGGLDVVPTGPAERECFGTPSARVTDNALAQWCERAAVKVPTLFARAMVKDHADVLADMLNALGKREPQRHLLRMLDGRNRAVLSDRYKVIDNTDVVYPMLQSIKDNGGVVLNATLTDRAMRMTVVLPKMKHVLPADKWGTGNASHATRCDRNALTALQNATGEDPVGTVYPMVRFSNSETGDGGLSATFGAFAPRCMNGLTLETVMRQVHMGGQRPEGLYHITEEAQQAENRAIMLKIRDGLAGAFNPSTWKKVIARLETAAATPVANPSLVVNRLVDESLISATDRDALLEHFLGGYDKTVLGLSQAVARLAQDGGVEQYEGYEAAAGTVVRDSARLLAV